MEKKGEFAPKLVFNSIKDLNSHASQNCFKRFAFEKTIPVGKEPLDHNWWLSGKKNAAIRISFHSIT